MSTSDSKIVTGNLSIVQTNRKEAVITINGGDLCIRSNYTHVGDMGAVFAKNEQNYWWYLEKHTGKWILVHLEIYLKISKHYLVTSRSENSEGLFTASISEGIVTPFDSKGNRCEMFEFTRNLWTGELVLGSTGLSQFLPIEQVKFIPCSVPEPDSIDLRCVPQKNARDIK